VFPVTLQFSQFKPSSTQLVLPVIEKSSNTLPGSGGTIGLKSKAFRGGIAGAWASAETGDNNPCNRVDIWEPAPMVDDITNHIVQAPTVNDPNASATFLMTIPPDDDRSDQSRNPCVVYHLHVKGEPDDDPETPPEPLFETTP